MTIAKRSLESFLSVQMLGEAAVTSGRNRPRLRMATVHWISIFALFFIGLETSNAQEIGLDICACQPAVYEFTLDFDLTCADLDVGGPGISDTTCLTELRGEENQDDADLRPVTVSQVSIFELDQNLDVIAQTVKSGTFLSGSMFTYTSIIATEPDMLNPESLPRGLQVVFIGNNALNQAVVNTFAILYNNDCGVFPLLREGQIAGWSIFTDLGNPPELVCPLAVQPSAAPTISMAPSTFPSTAPSISSLTDPPDVTVPPRTSPCRNYAGKGKGKGKGKSKGMGKISYGKGKGKGAESYSAKSSSKSGKGMSHSKLSRSKGDYSFKSSSKSSNSMSLKSKHSSGKGGYSYKHSNGKGDYSYSYDYDKASSSKASYGSSHRSYGSSHRSYGSSHRGKGDYSYDDPSGKGFSYDDDKTKSSKSSYSSYYGSRGKMDRVQKTSGSDRLLKVGNTPAPDPTPYPTEECIEYEDSFDYGGKGYSSKSSYKSGKGGSYSSSKGKGDSSSTKGSYKSGKGYDYSSKGYSGKGKGGMMERLSRSKQGKGSSSSKKSNKSIKSRGGYTYAFYNGKEEFQGAR